MTSIRFEMLVSRSIAVGACALVPLLSPGVAAAASGDGVGFGPVFAITLNGSAGLGWEVALSKSGPWAKLNLGGTYHVIREEGDPAFLHYAAWEPWAYGGITLGAAVTDSGAPRFMYGLWEAYAGGLDDNLYSGSPLLWAASIAVGWRGFGASVHQIYIAPKLWYIRGFDFFS